MSAVHDAYGQFTSVVLADAWKLAEAGLSPELRDAGLYHLATMDASKGVRPALVKAAAICADGRALPERELTRRGMCVQLTHEAMLVIDDALDESPRRRGRESLYHREGRVIATAVAAEFATLAVELIDDDPAARKLCRSLIREVCVAETLQERGRFTTRPTPLELWERIARGDTGAIFRLALELGGWSDPVIGHALAYLRHGIDDIEDLLDPDGDQADVRDRVPTLPSCFTTETTLEGLRAAIPQAREHLRRWTRPTGMPAPFAPFFADFAAALND